MEERIRIHELEPNAYEAMLGLENYLQTSGLDKHLIELIKIRASQINGCAYCLDMHTKDALANGEEPKKLMAISAWWESPHFTEKERAALLLTDEITRISEKGLTGDAYKKAKENFSDNDMARIIMAIGVINVWNRIAVSTHMIFEG